MSTPLTDGINALTAYANEVTGAEDTTLSDAVGRLCEGYGGGEEYVIVPDSSLTTSTNFDAYFSALVDGWNTELILIWLEDEIELTYELIGGWSAYGQTFSNAFGTIWRCYGKDKIYSITRSDWGLRIVAGKKYRVIRLRDHSE